MSGLLEGIKVLEMGHFVAIPAAGSILADWGAEVIKVEPVTGDVQRGVLKLQGVSVTTKYDDGEVHWLTEVYNRNKKGLAVDLKQDQGKEIIYKLVKNADVFMSNYEVSAMKTLKMDYATLSQLNPSLIYAVVTGYGTVGPDKDERGFDQTAGWARSGIMYMLGEPGGFPPKQRPALFDTTTGGHAVAGILAALLYRDKTGQGQNVECSLYASAVWTNAFDIQGTLSGQSMVRQPRVKKTPLTNVYRTGDGKYFQMAGLFADHWAALCKAIGKPEWETAPLSDSVEAREQNAEELNSMLDEIFASKPLKEWEERFRASGSIYGRVQTADEVVNDPQALANKFFAEVQHPVAGQMRLVSTPVTFLQNPATVKTPAPTIGQHTEEILLDLGYSWEDMVQLKDKNIIL